MMEGPSEDYEEDDMGEDDYEETETYLSCELLSEGMPCSNHGRCVIFEIATMETKVCPHFLIEDVRSTEVNN